MVIPPPKLSTKTRAGFTLIELLVVIAIIGMLASLVLASLNSARARSRDARKQNDLRQISIALQLFFDTNKRMPNNYSGGGQCEGDGFYEQAMGELVTGGFLKSIPKSPGGAVYCFYNYGAGNNVGVIMETTLETVPNSTTGIPPSCRPWAPSTNWCDQSSNAFYCICNPY